MSTDAHRVGEWIALAGTTGGSLLAQMELLPLEAALVEEGIPVRFDPWRPGEGVGPTVFYGVPSPIRLMVPQERLVDARRVARETVEADSMDLY